MNLLNTKEYKIYSNFLSNLANDLTKFYFSKALSDVVTGAYPFPCILLETLNVLFNFK